jgi:hypothetical protein
MSEKKKQKVYMAISDPIMDLRLSFVKARPLSAEELDAALFELEREIWRKVHAALHIQGPR